MTTKGERRIVHVKDIFPGQENGDYTQELETNSDEEFTEKPKVVQSTNSGVFFGIRSSSCINSIQDLRRSLKSHTAPRPPVLVDIDIGLADQELNNQELKKNQSRYNDQSILGQRRSGGHVPSAGGVCDDVTLRNGLSAQVNSNTGTNSVLPTQGTDSPTSKLLYVDIHSDRQHGGSGEQSSSGVETDSGGSPSSLEPVTPVAPPRGRNKKQTMTASSVDLPGPPSRRPVTPRAPRKQEDSNHDNELNDSVPPKPPLADVNGYHTEQEYDTTDSLDDEEDCAVLDFADEDYDDDDDDDDKKVPRVRPEHRNIPVYQEYKGDDYSQYLNDDNDVTRKDNKRRHKKRKGTKAPTSPTNASVSSGENTTRKGLKLQVGSVFNSQGSSKEPTVLSGNNIHNFTFADSKIGLNIQENDMEGTGTVRRFQKQNQDKPGSNWTRWWNKDTLSAHSLSSHSDILLKRRGCLPEAELHRAESCSAISDPTTNSTIRPIEMPESFSDSENAHPDQYTDFESYRKNIIYNTKHKKRSVGKQLWRRISSGFKKDAEYGENTTNNPLSNAVNGF